MWACQSTVSSSVADPGHAVERDKEGVPHAALPRQGGAAGLRQAVVAAPPLAGLLHPASFDQAAILELVQRRVERRDMEIDRAVGSIGDQPADVVAVARLFFDQGEDQHFGAAALQFTGQPVCDHMWARQIWIPTAASVNRPADRLLPPRPGAVLDAVPAKP